MRSGSGWRTEYVSSYPIKMDTGSQSWTGCRLMSRQTHDLRAQKFLNQRNPMGLCGPHRGIAIAKLNVAAATVQPALVPPIWNEALFRHAFGFVLVLSAFLSHGGASSLWVGKPRCAGGPVSLFQPTDRAQRDLSIQSERPRLAAGSESLRESVALISDPRSSHLDSSSHQNSCYAFHVLALFFTFFFAPPIILFWAGSPEGEAVQRVRRRNLDFRRIQTSLHNRATRRGKVILHKQYDRFGG
jgi:hypothetical protein